MTEGKNSKSESKQEQSKNERHFNQEQYDRLIECSEKGPEGIEQWNKWCNENPAEAVWLQGAYLEKANLQGAYLQFAKLQGADLQRADMQGAELHRIKLQAANLQFANLQGATFFEADLQGANLQFATLQRARFRGAIVNGSTNFLGCEIDENTDFRHTGLENVRIESGTKILLKYNIRRMNWEDWYKEHKRQKWLVRPFWWMSDYGRSISRIMLTFFILAFVFAIVYYLVPNLVKDLHITGHWYSDIIRSCYFSVVTMTTLGFGDMFANKESIAGHVLLMFQVILGYVLLGALVTRLTVLFTSDGPAGSFTPMDKETKELLAKLKKEDKGH
jgi:hypothetical protein